MKLANLIGFVAIGIFIPGSILTNSDAVLAREVRVNTPNVEAVTRSDGSVYLNSGDTTVQVPSRDRDRSRYWIPWRYWRLPWQQHSDNRPSCYQSSYQATTQTTSSGSSFVTSRVSNYSCY